MVVVPIVDRVWGTPISCATDATARSPSVCIIRVNPVGANANGSAARLPRMSRLVSIVDTSCNTDGWNSTRANASRARRSDCSPSAAPSQ